MGVDQADAIAQTHKDQKDSEMQTLIKHFAQQDCQTVDKDICDSQIQTTKQDFDVEACC